MDTQQLLSLYRIDQILSRHLGAKRALAREAGVSPCHITNVLHGTRLSERIVTLADQRARNWLEWERERNKPLVAGPDDE